MGVGKRPTYEQPSGKLQCKENDNWSELCIVLTYSFACDGVNSGPLSFEGLETNCYSVEDPVVFRRGGGGGGDGE